MQKRMGKKEDNKGKERITITIDDNLLAWLDRKVVDKIFANRSHGFEYIIKRKIEEEKAEEKKAGEGQ
ncbi:MAG: ribbon-helix-helix domain-containing protein [Candidatus Woesearchaeota archaeon]|nr:ribbon-helix-helix domain-containing protein [Candidatus Woesearchaeota archaeon]